MTWMLTNWGLLALVIVPVACISAIILINRARPPAQHVKTLNHPENLNEELGHTISLVTWNIGYGGLGKDSDFVSDGGKSWFPPSRHIVKQNVAAISAQLLGFTADALLLQEVCDNSPLSLWVPLRQRLLLDFSTRLALFHPDIASWGLPWPLRINHGTLTLCSTFPSSTQLTGLPAEPTFLARLLRRNYALLVSRFKIKDKEAKWVIVNLHLAAFDRYGATRFKQLQAVFEFAQQEYAAGNYVVLGGDWNLVLAKTSFPHTTAPEKLFWLVDMPTKKLPQGWKIACDPTCPTVRTNYQPYIKGQNHTAIIDGFITSPNVKIERVSTSDTQFKHTDHMPVSATFSTIPPE